MNVSTNLGRYFLNLIKKHFPPHYKFSKIFNRSNMQVSYSCMPNIKSSINMHKKTVANPQLPAQARTYNCINKSNCPLNNRCLSNNVLCKANIASTTENDGNTIYYDMTSVRPSSSYEKQTI